MSVGRLCRRNVLTNKQTNGNKTFVSKLDTSNSNSSTHSGNDQNPFLLPPARKVVSSEMPKGGDVGVVSNWSMQKCYKKTTSRKSERIKDTLSSVAATMTWTFCSQIICQKSTTVFSMGPWVAMYWYVRVPTSICKTIRLFLLRSVTRQNSETSEFSKQGVEPVTFRLQVQTKMTRINSEQSRVLRTRSRNLGDLPIISSDEGNSEST